MAASVQIGRLELDSSWNWGGGTSRLRRCETPDGRRRLLKQYTHQARVEIDADALHSVVDFPQTLSVTERSALEASTCWPDTIVLDGASVTGVLMPLASALFLEGSEEPEPRHMSRVGRPPGDEPYYQVPQKMARIGKLVGLVQMLHRNGVVVGDINPLNVLVGAADAAPQICLIDCDSVLVHGKGAFKMRQPPAWTILAPADNGFSIASDYGKMALLAFRSLYEDFALDSFDLEALQVILKKREIDLLDRAAQGRFRAGDEVAWSSLADTWEMLDTGTAELYYRNDQFEFRSWAGDIWPVPEAPAQSAALSEAEAVPEVETSEPAGSSAATGAQAAGRAGAPPQWMEILLGSALLLVGLVSVVCTLIVVVLSAVMVGSGDVAHLFGAGRASASARSSGAITMAVIAGLLAVLGAGVVAGLARWSTKVVVPLLSAVTLMAVLVFFGPPQQHVSAVADKVLWLGSIVPHVRGER